MIRIMHWNIEKFAINKISDTITAGKRKRTKATGSRPDVDAVARKAFILNTFDMQGGRAGPNVPDIISIVETAAQKGQPEGTLLPDGGGKQGSKLLLSEIRSASGNVNWMLVPPVIIGQGSPAEAVSVYFDSSKLFFTGPFVRNGSLSVAPAAGLIPNASTGKWTKTLPAIPTPAAAGDNPTIAQNVLAGQWRFFDTANNQILFPIQGERPPFLTTFWDIGGNRNIKLFSFHAPPPNTGLSAEGTSRLARIQEVTNLRANDVAVITGDFNVDLSNSGDVATAYENLIRAGYTMHLNPTTAVTMPDFGYCCTTLKLLYDPGKNSRSGGSGPWAGRVTGDQTDYGYPGYYYMASSYDNILTRYGTPVVGFPRNFTIVNRVVGTPYNRIVPAPLGAYTGGLTYTSALSVGNALPLPPPPPGGHPYNTKDVKATFRLPQNFGKIRSTSDHIPLIIEV